MTRLADVHPGTVVRLSSGQVVVTAVGPGRGKRYVMQGTGERLETDGRQDVEILSVSWSPDVAPLLVAAAQGGGAMKSREEILGRLRELLNDQRLDETATVSTNAPLVIIQTALKAWISALLWVLGEENADIDTLRERYRVERRG